MKGDYLHYKLLTLPAARWLPNPWLGTPGWGGPLAGRGKKGGSSMVNDHSFVGSGCTWVLGSLSVPCKACIVVCREVCCWWFCPPDNSGLLGDIVRSGRQRRDYCHAFNIYLEGLLFTVKRHDYYLMLCSLYLLGYSQPLGRCTHFSPQFIREVLKFG